MGQNNQGMSKKKIYAKLVITVIVLTLLIICIKSMPRILYCKAFISGVSNSVPVYSETKNKTAKLDVSQLTAVRGNIVKRYLHKISKDGNVYRLISLNGKKYYINDKNLSFTKRGAIQEKEIYVRTPATVYSDEKSPKIMGFAPKGAKYEIIDYDKLDDDGYVNKYKISYSEKTNNTSEESKQGYIHGKYVKGTEKEALEHYNKNGEFDKSHKDNYGIELYGGKAENLDLFPYQAAPIKDKDLCKDARAMYINTYAAVHPDEYVKLIKETDCNSVVIDIKDGPLTYNSDIAKEISPTSYEKAYATKEDFAKGVKAYKDTGVYTIGRIVVFNDKRYAKDHPENCIKDGNDTGWPSGFSREVWEYNVRIALEAVEKFGFDEIQFDYVRFPESSYEMSKDKNVDFRNKYNEDKAQAIQGFCMYATDMIHEAGAYVSVDVFGESAGGYVTAYGQYWPAISNVVDAISAMPYTDHFGRDVDTWTDPYSIMLSWSKNAARQQAKIESPAVARTWITGYDTPYWNTTVSYDTKKMKAQINALKDCGLDGGFVPWNVGSSLEKYKQYKSIWNK